MPYRPIIGLTMGDPVGIGPEIVVKSLCRKPLYDTCRPLVLGDVEAIRAANRQLATGLMTRPVATPETGCYQWGTIDVVGVSNLNSRSLKPGHPIRETSLAMVQYIIQGVDWAMEGRIQGLATCPVNKKAMEMAGFHFSGHTELLAERTNTSDYVMMLAGTRLRVALVTIHLPLREVSNRLTPDAVIKTIRITEEALRRSFAIARPRLAIAALNPHAGENGLFGDEETRIISPALHQVAKEGIHVSGPHPPDTVFYWALKGSWDAVIALYHDQGLIPFKMVHFTDGVNTTLGLPIVRTSVDHGTAYDIAGKGEADPGSLMAAVHMAAYQATRRLKGTEQEAASKDKMA